MWVLNFLSLLYIFIAIIAVSFIDFYKVQYVTETYQMEIRKDVQTINKRLLFAMISKDSDVTKEQETDLLERFDKIENYAELLENLVKQFNLKK